MPSVLFLFHLCIHCLGEFFVQGFGHSEASVEFRLGSAFRVRVTNTVSGEFDYASGQGSVRAKRYGNLANVILLVFILLYTNKIAVIAPCKRNRIETKSVF